MLTIKRLLVWLVLAGLAAAAMAAWYFDQPEENAQRFLTAKVAKGDIEESVSAIGNIQPSRFVDIGTQVTGLLKNMSVDIGDVVKKDDLLAEIDPALLMARVDGTRATLLNLKAQLREKQATERLSGLTHERNRELYAKGAASKELLQQSSAALEQAEAQVAALRAQIQQTESQLRGDEANLRYTKFFAPMAGTVVSIAAREGQTLVASQQTQTLLRIADLSTMTVWAQVSEADVPKITLGMPVYFNTLGLVDRRWEGKVRQIMPTPESVNNVVLYNVLFDVQNPDGALRTQMSAQVYFVLGRADGVLSVPTAALGPLKDGAKAGKVSASGTPSSEANDAGQPSRAQKFMVRVLKEGKPDERLVSVGVMNRVSAQVLSGLSEGDTVITGIDEGKGKGKDKDKTKSRELPQPGRT
ncbi:MAG: efflux RND transporter periplasmic adaptor subunit [Burkholderiales bacterium]